MEYTFTLNYQLADDAEDRDLLVERLAAAGCDDALIGLGVAGRMAMEFMREAPSAERAIESALQEVKSVMPSARLIEVAPDYVGLTDVAELIGVSRQNMRKLMLTHYQSFPLPLSEGNASIWHLADVLRWLESRGGYRWPAAVQETAQVALSINLSQQIARYQRD